jgi:tRNA modification GTPase
LNLSDTIVAISTPPGRGGIGVVRLSGPEARVIAERLVRFRTPHDWRPWSAGLGDLIDEDERMVDRVVVS